MIFERNIPEHNKMNSLKKVTKETPKIQNKCTCCKKIGHNITTCTFVVKQGIFIENHIQALMDNSENDNQFRSRLSHYLRNLSTTHQKILSVRIGTKYQNHLSCSIIFRYFIDKLKSRKIMRKIYGVRPLSFEFISIPTDKMYCPIFSQKPERKILKKEMEINKTNKPFHFTFQKVISRL